LHYCVATKAVIYLDIITKIIRCTRRFVIGPPVTLGTEWIISAPEWIIFFWRNSHFVKQQAADKNFSKLQIPLFSTYSTIQKRIINKGIRTQSAIQIDRYCPLRIRSRKIKAKHDKRNHQKQPNTVCHDN